MHQFVVLHHKMPDGSHRADHWDLMLQQDDVLWTWALNELPAPQTVCRGKKLPNHDLKYLDYEGPIGRQRGSVTRVIAGQFKWLAHSPGGVSTAMLFVDNSNWKMTIKELGRGETCQFKFE